MGYDCDDLLLKAFFVHVKLVEVELNYKVGESYD